jgi:hypothetical protein
MEVAKVMASEGGSIGQPHVRIVCVQTPIKRQRETSDALDCRTRPEAVEGTIIDRIGMRREPMIT